MLRSGPRVLIIRLSAIGDVIVTTPVTRALRETYPDAHLTWVVEPKARDVLVANPFLDEVLVWDRHATGWQGLLTLSRRLRGRHFDWAVDCQGNLRSALVARLSGAKRIVGSEGSKERAGLFYHDRIPRRKGDFSSRQRCLDLLQPLGVRTEDRRMVVQVTPEERAAGRAVLRSEGVPEGHPYACMVPATTWPQKHWTEPEWADLGGRMTRDLGLTAVWMGSGADREMVERIRGASAAPGAATAGKTTLKTAAAILEGAKLTVAVDTALMHASVAVGTPTVAVCGASWWKGFQDYERFALVREPMPCSPCLHKPTCGGRFDCMRALSPVRVLGAARDLLRNGGTGLDEFGSVVE